jgi:hypothetical protein
VVDVLRVVVLLYPGRVSDMDGGDLGEAHELAVGPAVEGGLVCELGALAGIAVPPVAQPGGVRRLVVNGDRFHDPAVGGHVDVLGGVDLVTSPVVFDVEAGAQRPLDVFQHVGAPRGVELHPNHGV